MLSLRPKAHSGTNPSEGIKLTKGTHWKAFMGKRLYVGNLPYSIEDTQLRALFETGGRKVTEVKIVTDRETGRPRGFAFVEMSTDDEAQAVIGSLHGTDVGGRTITVNEARERAPRGPGGPSAFGGPRAPRGPGGGGGGFGGPGGGGGFGGDGAIAPGAGERRRRGAGRERDRDRGGRGDRDDEY
jgi:RNA recognition motif-containing protein